MPSIFEPFDRLSQLIGQLRPPSQRFGKRKSLFGQMENCSLEIYPGGSHWQIIETMRTKKPDWIPDDSIIPSLQDAEEFINNLQLWNWETTLTHLQSSEKMIFSACKIQLLGVTQAVFVATVNTEKDYFYAVKREVYDSAKHGINLPVLINQKDLMIFYYLSGIEKEDVPNPNLLKGNIPSRPNYDTRPIPDLILEMGAKLNSRPEDGEDQFWGGKKNS